MRTLYSVGLAIIVGWAAPASAQMATAIMPPTISVSGSAEVRVPPDEVLLTLGIESRNRDLDAAKSQNDQRVASLLRFLKESGIEAKDIQTDQISIRPEYQRDRQDVPEFYIVQRNIGLRLRRVGDFEKVLTGALKSGVNQVHGIDFRTTELRKHRDAARKLAVQAAREKALDLTRELDTKLGKVQSISESTWDGYWGVRGNTNMTQNSVQMAGPPTDADSNLSVGQISITATVQVTFQLVP